MKNKQYIVLTPHTDDSGWERQECHTPDEAAAIAVDLYRRGNTEVKIVNIANGTCLPLAKAIPERLSDDILVSLALDEEYAR